MRYHFKRINYTQLEKTTTIPKGKIVVDEKEFKMMKDYIIMLEGWLHSATNKTFKSIPEELLEIFGEERCRKWYGDKMNG